MEELQIRPHGEIKKTSKWNTITVRFNSGKEQKQRKQVIPDITWNFTFSGTHTEREYLENFFNARCGDLLPFYYTINGVKEVVCFAGDSLDFTEYREIGKPIGYQAQVAIKSYKD